MLVQLECLYCGFKKETNMFSRYTAQNQRCDQCNDRNIKVTELEREKIDYYADPYQYEKQEEEKTTHVELDDYDDYL